MSPPAPTPATGEPAVEPTIAPQSPGNVAAFTPNEALRPYSSPSSQHSGFIQAVAAPPPAVARRLACLEVEDGTVFQGYSFGAATSSAGELVFQTGMVGYPESLTDPSYRGQLLVITFPLVGNYGVPPREALDELLGDLPKHFESNKIHISGLVVASDCADDFSHHVAQSSLGHWLAEEGIPGIFGVDTRALTKKIRQNGSMLGKMLLQKEGTSGDIVPSGENTQNWRSWFQEHDWINPNTSNLVADGKIVVWITDPGK